MSVVDLERRDVLRGALLMTIAGTATIPGKAARAADQARFARFSYTGCRTTKERGARGKGINVYRVDPATGAWTHVQLVEDLVNPSFLAFDRERRFLYALHGDFSEISSFRIDREAGSLMPINRQSTGAGIPFTWLPIRAIAL